VVGAAAGDAITTSALALRAQLRALGPSDIYARYFDPGLAGEVQPLSAFASRRHADPDDVIVFHMSIGDPDVLAFLEERPERVVLVYHNISPSEPFRAFDPRFADLLASGRRSLTALRSRCVAAVADSTYNAAELTELGFGDVAVMPLLIDPARLRRLTPDGPTAHHLDTVVDGPVVLFVGQVLPHKRPDLLLEAYHALVTYLRPDAHLILVGAGRVPRYQAVVQAFAHELNLSRAWLTGAVSDEQLAAFYRRADVFVSASDHEGFGVPLLEAMAFGVPVVARATAAVPETVAEGGLLVPPDASPLVLTEAVAAVFDDPAVRAALVEGGRRRLDRIDMEADAVSALAILRAIV
jgi:glycosyltransferase involved in cell wall biosynthesis